MFVRLRGLALAGAVFVSVLSSGPALAAGDCGDVSRALKRVGSDGVIQNAQVKAVYEAFSDSCAWDEESAETLTAALMAAGDHGLDPNLFNAGYVQGNEDAAERDVLLTDGALRYARAMMHGLSGEIGGGDGDKDRAHHPKGELVDELVHALQRRDIQSWIEGLQPRSESYRRLMSALQSYRAIEQAGGFPVMPDALVAKSKRSVRDYALLRKRLVMEGDLDSDSGVNAFDGELRDGVASFQERNGLYADGRLNWKTLQRLNISAGERIAQISVNLERLRASQEETPETRVEVNVPAATAMLYRDGIPHLGMNVVVGAVGHETPTLRSKIDTIVINPTWTVPESIIEKEIKPAMARRKNYLRRNHMYWSGDQLIQEPGPHNSLGRVKFDFPNRYSVYLHDTPARHLFTNPERAESHGCVRLQKPLDLAAALLEGSRWDRQSLQDAIDRGTTRRVAVPDPMAVVIVYQTVFVADNGAVNFRPDVYGWDTKLTLALAQRAGS